MDPFRPLTRLCAPLFAHPRWPQLRALLIGLHLVAVSAVACPAPIRSMNAASWKRPGVQMELRAWTKRLNAVGIPWTTDDLRRHSTTIQETWQGARKNVVWPFQRYLRLIGAPQGWYMFTGPDREPQRFMLSFTSTTTAPASSTSSASPASSNNEDAIAVGDDEVVVFDLGRTNHHPELIDPDFLDDHRVRRALFQSSWSKNDGTFRLICDGFSRHLRARRADVDDVICRLIARSVEHPWRRGEPRPARVTRQMRIGAGGEVSEEKDGQAVAIPKRRTRGKKREILNPRATPKNNDDSRDTDTDTDDDARPEAELRSAPDASVGARHD